MKMKKIVVSYVFSNLRKGGANMDMKKIIVTCAVLVLFQGLAHGNAHGGLPANFPTVTTYIYDANVIADGYVFLAVAAEVEGVGYYVLIVDNDGNVVWYKEANDDEIYDFKVLPNGHLHYAAFIEPHSWTGGGDAIHVILDENFNEVEVIEAGNGYVAESHDFQMLPNGHALLIGYYMSEVDMSQIVDGGHPGAIVSGAIVQELDGNKGNRNVVFQWRTWDTYAFEDRVSSTRAVINAFHFNTINQDFDGQIFTSGIRKLDRQTGEVMYILGGSENEFTFVGADADPDHVGGHAFHRLASGNVMNFDNGRKISSRVHEYAIDEPNKVATHVWTYTPEPGIPTYHRGNAKRLPNGNTFIGWGGARSSARPIPTCTEVSPDGRKVFEIYFDHPDIESYRAFRFPYPPSSQATEDTESDLAAGNTYVFDDTGVAIKVIDLIGDASNEVKVTREPYAPVYPEFAGKAPRVLAIRVKVDQSGIESMTAETSFGAESFDFEDSFCFDDPSVLTVYHREFPGQGLFVPLPTIYNHDTKQLTTTMTQFGEFIFCFADIEDVPFAPILNEPENYRGVQEYMVIAPKKAKAGEQYTVNQELPILLSWSPVGFARSYQLQVARDARFKKKDLVVEETYLTEARYIMETAEPSTTYCYRVRTTNEGGTGEWSAGCFRAVPPMVEVTAPDGCEQWKRGLEYFIKWKDNIAEDVVIELYKGDTLVQTIGTVPSDRAYEWEVDLGLDPGCDYSIKIKSSVNEALFDVSDTFAIDPPDTTPPIITCPNDIVVSGFGPIPVSFTVTATDDCDPSPTVTTDIPSGSLFKQGITTVTATATDACCNSSTCSFDVIVSCFAVNHFKLNATHLRCRGIALLEVTSDQGVFVYTPDPGKIKLKKNTIVDDGVNGRVKIHTSGSKPLDIGDVFGAYTVTNVVKIFDSKPDNEGNDLDVKGTFDPAIPVDLSTDDVTYYIDDGQGHILDFTIPAGLFRRQGKPEEGKFKFMSPKGSYPEIDAKFDFAKCRFDLKVKRIDNLREITGRELTVGLYAGVNVAEETVKTKLKGQDLMHKKTPKLHCCPE